jgi:hypothetical protein
MGFAAGCRSHAEEAEHLIGLFDQYRPEKAVLVAPHLHI